MLKNHIVINLRDTSLFKKNEPLCSALELQLFIKLLASYHHVALALHIGSER